MLRGIFATLFLVSFGAVLFNYLAFENGPSFIFSSVAIINQKSSELFGNAEGQIMKELLFELPVTKKFIVVTTVRQPTEDIQRLAKQSGWTVVVVGDKKTPTDWNFPGVHFISVDVQKHLDYSVLEIIPYRSYTRKMIGYLYAIERGAEWIYDTDDDNKPFRKGLQQFDYEDEVSGVVYYSKKNFTPRANVFQPYSFFGRPDIWPRGFPLESLKDHRENKEQYSLCKSLKVPSVQQGLVRKDPDVDAIFRLINADEKTGLNEDFNPHAPPVILGPDVYSPFNSQNTLFRYSAFFTLLLPVSVAFRVTDIWRSYFAQKLLHLSGQSLGFYPANAVQSRNAHSFLQDFKDEMALYEEAGRIIRFLSNWTCDSHDIVRCTVTLAKDFAREGFWGKVDIELAKRWVQDLMKLNYSFPQMSYDSEQYSPSTNDSHRFVNCRRMDLHFQFAPESLQQRVEKEEAAIRSYRELDDWCGKLRIENSTTRCYDDARQLSAAHSDGMFAKYKKIALIITNNYAFGPPISVLQRLYEPFFATTIYCGPFYKEKLQDNAFPTLKNPINYIHVPDSQMQKGFYGYYCASKAIEIRLQNLEGFVVMSDDTVFNLWNKFRTDVLVIKPYNTAKRGWWNSAYGMRAIKNTIHLINNKYRNDTKVSSLIQRYSKKVKMSAADSLQAQQHGWRMSDFFFIPAVADHLSMFHGLAELLFEGGVFHEIALDKIADAIGVDSNYSFKYLWSEARNNWEAHYNADLLMLHPVKLSTTRNPLHRHKVCKFIIEKFKEKLLTMK